MMPDTIRVLYIDDEKGLLEIGRIFLEHTGSFSVDVITSATEALTRISSVQYDAIVSDYQMPGMDGIAFLKKVRASGNPVPFILFTGRGREEVVIQALNEGADFYLQKGGEPEAQFMELSHKIRQAVQQRRAETSIRNYERRESDILNFLPDATFAIDTNGVVIAWNRAMEAMTGVPAQQMLGKGDYEYALPFYGTRRPILIDLIQSPPGEIATRYSSIVMDGTVLVAETTIPDLRGESRVLWGKATQLYDTRGTVVGALESIRDITGRNKAEEQLKASEERYQQIDSSSRDAIYAYNREGRFTHANRALCELLGLASGEILGKTHEELGFPPEQSAEWAALHDEVYTTGATVVRETKTRIRGGPGMSFEVVLNPIHSTDGTVIGISGVTRDITGRKQAEEELVRKNEELQASYGQIAANEEELRRSLDELTLRESALLQSEERYRSFIAVSNTGAWEYHGKADFLWCSPEYFSMLGRDAGRFDMSGAANLKETWLDLLHPDDRERAGKHFAEYLGNGSAGMYENHFRVQHADGHWVWVWSRGRTLRDADGTLTDKTVGTHIDVTAGVCAEDALRESEGRYRSLYVDSRDAILLVSPERGFIAANPAAIQLFAFRNEQDFILCSPASLSPAYQPDGVLSTTKSQEMMHLALEKGSNFFEWTHCKSDGTEFPATVLLSRLESGGTQLLQATVRDITGQKRAEEESRQHEKTLEALNKIISAANYAGDLPSLLDAGLDTTLALLEYDAGGIYLTDHEAGTAAVVASRNLPGWLLEQVGNVSIRQPQYEPLLVRGIPIITEHYEQVSPEYAERSGFCSIASIPLVSRDCIIGALNVASTRRAVVTGEERETLLSIGRELGTTIVRFRAEDVAGENAANLEILFNSIDEMVFILALDGTILRANGAVRRTLGYSDEELTGRDVLSLHVPDRRDEALRIVQGMIAGTINSCPVPVVAKDGTVIEAETRVTRGWWDNREVLIGVTRDVTERKRAEEALKESEQKYRDLVESSQDAIFSVDRNGFYQFANSAYASTLGYTPEYFDGKSFWDIYPKDLADMRHEGVLKVFETGQPGEVEVVVPLPDRTLYYLAKTNPITDSKGNIVQVLVTATDITERKREEEALLINENRLQMTQEIGHIGCWEYDIKTNLMWGSEEGCHLFGYPRKAGSFPIENFASCITEPELVLKAFNDLIYEGKEYDLDFIINPKDGSAQKTLHSIGRLEKDELGNPVKVKGINHDITERKRAEEALRESEEKYRALFTAESDGIFVVDKETGTIIDCNDAVTSMYGYQKDEVIGRPNTAISAEPGATRAATSAVPGFIPERHHKKKDGSVFPVEITANAISINGRDVIVAAVRDITERKVAEAELAESEARYRNLIETSHDIIYSISPDGVLLFVSPAWTHLLGYPVADVTGRNFAEFVHPDDLPACYAFLEKVLGSGERQEGVEYRVRHADGTWYWHTSSGTPVRDAGGVVTRFTGIARDITERKKAEDALQLANRKLNLLSSITRHDINNQLSVLMGYLSILEKKPHDPILNSYFQKASTAAEQIASIIRFTKEYEEVGVRAPKWENCRAIVDVAAKAAPLGGVLLNNDLPPGNEVFADPLILKVFYNLMDNAVRYGVKITTICFSGKESSDDYLIVCEDDGIGIPADEKEKIFERGYGKNTGLGLALSREILSITGITIRETGEPGKGARFEMTVPKGMWR